MEFEGNFKNEKRVLKIRCKSNTSSFTSVEIICSKNICIESRCIEFMNHITSVRNYLYIIKSECECCLLNDKLTYIYKPISYFYSRNEISKSGLKSISEIVVVNDDVAVSTAMLSDRVAKYNKRLIHHAKVSLEQNGVDYTMILPLKMMIVKQVINDSYVRVSGHLLREHETNYASTIRSYYYYNKIVLGCNPNIKYAICKSDNGRFFYVDNSLTATCNSPNGLFDIKNYSYKQFYNSYLYNVDIFDKNIMYLGTVNTGDRYDYIYKYSAVVTYVLNNYNVSNDLCIDIDVRSEVNGIVKEYRKGNFRKWEFKLDKAKNSQLIAIALLLYREGLLNNSQLPKFSNCTISLISNSDVISIAERLTERRNSYCHGQEGRFKYSNSLHELLNEIYHLVIYKVIGVSITRFNANKLYCHLAVTDNYSDEVAMYS